jgi:biotin carboxylase
VIKVLVLVESNTTGSGRLFCAAARRLGLRPVLLSRDPDRYPYVAADSIEHRIVDTTDARAVLEAVRALDGPVAGVTSSSEYSIGIAAALARELGRPHPDPEAILVCRDKFRQRARLAAGGVPVPGFAAATSPAQAVTAAARIGLPVVVKPVAGSGSIGVRRCETFNEVHAAAAAILLADLTALALPPQSSVVVEQYLAGAEYSVETFDEHAIGVTRKHLGEEPYFVETGHDFPAPLPAAEAAAIGEAAVTALRALGLGWGAAHVELRLTGVGPRIVEVNPRLAGGMIPRMVAEATGIDLIGLMVAKAAGLPVSLAASRRRSAAIRFLVASSSGRFLGVQGIEAALAVPGVVDVGLNHPMGKDIVVRHSFQDRLGYVIASASAGSVASEAAETGLRTLEATIAPASLVKEGSLGS